MPELNSPPVDVSVTIRPCMPIYAGDPGVAIELALEPFIGPCVVVEARTAGSDGAPARALLWPRQPTIDN